MRLDDLVTDPEAWLAENERLWRAAHDLAARNPGIDVGDLYHALVQLQRTPEERLARSLATGRGLRAAHEQWRRGPERR